MMTKTLRTLILGLALTALILAGCSSKDKDKDDKTSSKDNTPVSIQLNWLYDASWAGFYAAEKNGYFADENLTVDLRSVFDADGNFLEALDEVSEGRADFGIAESTNLLVARAAGKPVVGVATIYQQHPLAFTSLAEKNIVIPQDLVGATVDVSSNSTLLYQALLMSQEIAPARVNERDRTDFSIQSLINGDTDVIDAWVTSEIPILVGGGYEINMIFPSDYGIVTYPNVIFTTEDMIANHPDVVERFVRATVKGLDYASSEPDASASLVVSYNAELNLDEQIDTMQRSLPLIHPVGSKPGMMTAEVWESTQQILLDQGNLSEPVDLTKAYTTQFLDAIYQ